MNISKNPAIWCKRSPVVEHGKELDHNRCRESQNEHEGDGIDLYIFSGELEVEVDLGELDGEGSLEELEGKCCHQPQGVQNEEGEVYLYIMRKMRLV